MVIVTGRPPDILTATTRALCERGVTARVVMRPESTAPDELSDLVWAKQPSHVIAVDARGVRGSDDRRDDGFGRIQRRQRRPNGLDRRGVDR